RHHGGGGPGAGPVAVNARLERFLPAPVVGFDEETGRYSWDHDRPDAIGRVHGVNGHFGVLVRAFAYVFGHGRDGLRGVGVRAVLKASYLSFRVEAAFPLALPGRP